MENIVADFIEDMDLSDNELNVTFISATRNITYSGLKVSV